MAFLELNEVRKAFNQNVVVQNFNLAIERGEQGLPVEFGGRLPSANHRYLHRYSLRLHRCPPLLLSAGAG